MNDRTRHITEGVRKFSPLLQAFEEGYSIEEIRAATHAALWPEFRNPVVLERYGIDLLTAEAVNISKIKNQPDTQALYKACLAIRTSVLAKDQERCAKVCSEWEQDIGSGLSLYWKAARFEIGKTDLPLDEFAYEVFRNIGSLLEATMLPYLRELLHLSLEDQGKNPTKEDIESLDFGNVVTQLETICLGFSILRPQPSNIPLNQWRNIAQHFSVNTDASTITCKYGRGKRHTATFTRDALWQALISLISIHLAIRTSHTIFFMDNGDALALHCKGFARRDDDLQFQFVVGAASQGFEVTDLSVSQEISEATFRDVTTGEATPRGIHASQFVLSLWEATKSTAVQITYITKTGTAHLRARVAGQTCQQVANGDRDMKYLAKTVELTLLSRDID